MMKLKQISTLLIAAILSIAAPVKSYAIFGIGDIVFDPAAFGQMVEDAITAGEQLTEMIEMVQQAREMVRFATEAKRVMGDPESALMLAGFVLGADDYLADVFGTELASDIKKTYYEGTELAHSFEMLDADIERFERAKPYSSNSDLYQKYARVSRLMNKYEQTAKTGKYETVVSEHRKKQILDDYMRFVSRLNDTLTDQERSAVVAGMDSMFQQHQIFATEAQLANTDLQVQVLKEEIKEDTEATAVAEEVASSYAEYVESAEEETEVRNDLELNARLRIMSNALEKSEPDTEYSLFLGGE